MKLISAILATQSSSSSASSIESAAASHARIFIVYIVFLIFAAVMTAVLTYLVWSSGNRLQDAIRTDANSRIETARADAANANANSAEAERKAAEAGKGTARALADVEAAKERTGILELEAAKQREKAAKAERELFELRQRVAPRRLSAEQRAVIISTLRQSKPATLRVIRLGDAEAAMFAADIIPALQEAGWSVTVVEIGVMSPPPYGLIYRSQRVTESTKALAAAMHGAGISLTTETGTFDGSDALFVGLKPVAPG